MCLFINRSSWAPLVAQLVKNLPVMREVWVQSLGWEDSLEKGKATHSSILPGEFHRQYSPWARKELDLTEQEEKGMTEDEMAGWHHRLDGHGFG